MVTKTVVVPDYELAEEVQIEPGSTAVVVVDMLNDFVRLDGALPIPGAEDTIPTIRRLLAWARDRGVWVAYTQDTHLEGDPEWAIWPRHAELGSEGWEIVPELSPATGEMVFQKARYDGFYGTSLDHELRRRGIDCLIIVGTAANICVHYTAASAGLRLYRIIHPIDALSALTPFDFEAALRQASFLFQAVLTTTDTIVKA